MSRIRLVTILVLLFTAAADRARAQPGPSDGGAPVEDVDIAKAHFNTGQTYYEKGRFADAAREFEEAYRLSQKAPLLYNVGKSYDGSNDFARALDAYQRFLAAAPPDNPDREFAQNRIAALERIVGRITVAGAVAGSTVALDGAPVGNAPLPAPLVVNPATHKLEVAHEGYATFRASVDVPMGGNVTLAVKQVENVKVVTVNAAPNPRDVPIYRRWWLWAAVGGAAVAAGVIAAVVVTSNSSNNGLPTVQLPQVK